MAIDIEKESLEKHLGESVEVMEGKKEVLGLGVLAYEHNTGKLSIYSQDRTLKGFLKGKELIRFLDDHNIYRVPNNINKNINY